MKWHVRLSCGLDVVAQRKDEEREEVGRCRAIVSTSAGASLLVEEESGKERRQYKSGAVYGRFRKVGADDEEGATRRVNVDEEMRKLRRGEL
jgi:nitroimidazol reductase NimA-like FMN-containing flavoprotein (pyridoxamine 5'-phosphate oxidase superfamily)